MRASLTDITEPKPFQRFFFSGLDEAIDKIKGFEAGEVDHIARPFQIEEIPARVDTRLDLRRL